MWLADYVYLFWYGITKLNMDFFRNISRKHEELKKKIHSFRIPLSPRGQKIMGFVYFTIPIIAGYYIMQVKSLVLIWCKVFVFNSVYVFPFLKLRL
jgi:hypothetical protein